MNTEDLISKIENSLRADAEEGMSRVPGIVMISRKEREALVTRALSDPAIARRVRIHAQAWSDDVVALAVQLAEEALARRLKRATKIYSEK